MLVTGSVKNLIQGVSTQNPRERIEGQAWTVRNMIPDPTEGEVRRPGVRHIKSTIQALPAEAGEEMYWQDLPIEAGDFAVGTYAGHIILRSLQTGDIVPVSQEPATYPYFMGGILATANIGEYTLLSGDAIPQAVTQQKQSLFHQTYRDNSLSVLVDTNRVVVFEVRQGAYSGVYSIKRNDGSVLASYTVPNGSVSAHADNVQPGFIALQLYNTLVATIGGSVGANTIRAVQQQGASVAIFFNAPTPDEAIPLYADDGYYNTRLKMTDRFVSDSNVLPAVGIEGHVVEVGSTSNSSGNYFLRFQHTQSANADGEVSLSSNLLRPGVWVETSRSYANTGYSEGGQLVESSMPALMYLYDGTAYVGTGAWIAAQIQSDTGFVVNALSWGSRIAGDDSSAADPAILGSRIVWMGILQDRLVLMSENGVTMSRTSDYMNLYRASVIDDLATDPINFVSTFDSTDTLIGAAFLDKSLVVVGTKSHYSISGRVALTPTNANLLKTASFESSPNTHPVSFGNQVYFASASAKNSDILAIQPSDVTDSTYAYSVSSHVDGFLPGDFVALRASTKVDILFALSASGTLYCYRTLFNQSDRILSAWFEFTFEAGVKLSAIALSNTRIRMLFSAVRDNELHTVVGELDLDRIGYTGTAGHRYLDFWTEEHPQNIASTNYFSVLGEDIAENGLTVDTETNLVALSPEGEEDADSLDPAVTYMTGVRYTYVYEPTMPLPKDNEGRVMGIGKLVVTQMQLNYTVASNFSVTVKDRFREHTLDHAVRQVDAPDSFTDQDYIREGYFMFPVGSSELGCRVSVYGNNHYPLVLSSIDWKGQFYKRGMQM